MGVTKLEEPDASEATRDLGVTWLRAAAHHDPSLPEIHLALGGALEGNASIRHYALAANLAEPNSTVALTALHNAGLLLRSLARFKECEVVLRRVLAHAPKGSAHYVGASNGLSLIEIEEEAYERAITRLKRDVLEGDPSHAAGKQNLALALYRRAKMLLRSGKKKEAISAKAELRSFLAEIANRRGTKPGLPPVRAPAVEPCCSGDVYADSCDSVYEASSYFPSPNYATVCQHKRQAREEAAERFMARIKAVQEGSGCRPGQVRRLQMPTHNGFGSIVNYVVAALATAHREGYALQWERGSLEAYTSCPARSFACYFEPVSPCSVDAGPEVPPPPPPPEVTIVPDPAAKHVPLELSAVGGGVMWYRSLLLAYITIYGRITLDSTPY